MSDFMELVPPPPPGIYTNVPMEEYARWDAVNNSSLSILLDKSPYHYRWERHHQKPPTDAKIVGNAIHTAVLQPDLFDSHYRLLSQCEASTAKGAQCSKQGSAFQGGRCLCGTHSDPDAPADSIVPLTPNQYEKTMGASNAVLTDPKASEVLASVPADRRELSIVFIEPITGLTMKGRIDGDLKQISYFLDLKSTMDASQDAFSKAIWDYGYHRQGALYLSGLWELGEERDGECVIAVEKEPPYAVSFWEELDQNSIDAGRSQLHDLLHQLKVCIQSDSWPAHKIERWVGIPEWAFKHTNVQYMN